MNPALQSRLAALQNRATRYELVATDGTRTVLAGYTRKGRRGLLSMLAAHANDWEALTGDTGLTWAKKAADGATMGAWKIKFSGRTQRDALLATELPFFRSLLPAKA